MPISGVVGKWFWAVIMIQQRTWTCRTCVTMPFCIHGMTLRNEQDVITLNITLVITRLIYDDRKKVVASVN